jgi:hypothetical protein
MTFWASPAGAATITAGAQLASSFLTGKDDPTGINYNMKRELNQRRRFHEQQVQQIPEAIKAKVQGLRNAGLHPLAALGMSFPTTSGPSGGGVPSRSQSPLGSAIAEGARAYGQAQARQHAQEMGQLGLEEQQLRNDWLRQQLAHQKWKMLQQMANAAGRGTGGHGTQAPALQEEGVAGFGDKTFKTGKSTSAQTAEDRWWEFGGAAFGVANAGYDIVGNLLSQSLVDDIINSIHPPGGQSWRSNVNRFYGNRPDPRGYKAVYPPSARKRPKYPTHRHLRGQGRRKKFGTY